MKNYIQPTTTTVVLELQGILMSGSGSGSVTPGNIQTKPGVPGGSIEII